MSKKILTIIVIVLLASIACSFTPRITIHAPRLGLKSVSGSGNVITESRPVSGFDQVIFNGFGTLNIRQGAAESLQITADDNLLQYITTEVRNNVLTIGWKDNVSISQQTRLEFDLVVVSLNRLEHRGAGEINAAPLTAENFSATLAGLGNLRMDSITTGKFVLRLEGAGDVSIDSVECQQAEVMQKGLGSLKIGTLTANSLESSLEGAGSMDLSGAAPQHELTLTGLGSYNAGSLQSQTVTLLHKGAGQVTVWATSTLDVTIEGLGDVNYYGDAQVTSNIKGLGSLKRLGSQP